MLSRGALAATLSLFVFLTLISCGPGSKPSADDADHSSGTSRAVLFDESTDELGLRFIHSLNLTGKFPLQEITGAGMAVFDANGDGRLDLLCLESGSAKEGVADRLFLQGADGKLKDVGPEAGFVPAFSTGCAVGDIDNDGDLDVYVGAVGQDHLYLNDGHGRFRDVGDQMGFVDNGFSTSIALLDYNLDGYLDVFVCRCSVLVDPPPVCVLTSGRQDYCHPTLYDPISSQLWRNEGGKRFVDVSADAGIAKKDSYGLGVTVDDFNDDSWPDLYVANDSVPNFMWINDKMGHFEEVGLMSGTAVNSQGASEGSMGLAIGDIDGNGYPDIFTTNVRRESNTLYLGEQGLNFTDGTATTGLAAASLPYTGWGTAFFDPDNDGDLDLMIVNGSVARSDPPFEGARKGTHWEHYAEGNLFFENIGQGRLRPAQELAGAPCSWLANHRSLVAVDFDGDGGEDVFTNAISEDTKFYRNVDEDRGYWIKVDVIDPKLKRRAMGAVVRVYVGKKILRGFVNSATSYLASCLAPLQFGLGDHAKVDRVEVIFPGGETQVFPGGAHGQVLVLERKRK